VHALAAADGLSASHQRAEAEVARHQARFDQMELRLMQACARASAESFEQWLSRPALSGAGDFLRRLRERAERSMSAAEEDLAAELGMDGLSAWGRLYDRVTAGLDFTLSEPGGGRRTLPISARRSLLEDPDRGVRRAAFEGGNAAFASQAPVLAAALNHIAGTRLTLTARRGHADFLEPALIAARISRATLEALLSAIRSEREVPARVLRLKARLMGLPRLAWFDLGAPFPVPAASDASAPLPWPRALEVVGDAFARYPALADFFRAVVENRWVDHSPRPGKRPGAFCTTSPHIDESRVFMTYQGTPGDVSTLAHEVGHAFHGALMRDVRYHARRYPMTLAESASTFAELILAHGWLESPSLGGAERRAVLSGLVGDAPVFLMDIPARFAFEKAFYEERAGGEVSTERLGELMVTAQRAAVGEELLDPAQADPLYWASKLHFFLTGVPFYNFPYSFGYLLSWGLYGELERTGSDVLPRYERLLRRSGSGEAHEIVAESLGVNLEGPEFWVSSIHALGRRLDRLELELSEVGEPGP
jgi:oligoendopeptidase F